MLMLSVDIIGILPWTFSGYKYILSVVHSCSLNTTGYYLWFMLLHW